MKRINLFKTLVFLGVAFAAATACDNNKSKNEKNNYNARALEMQAEKAKYDQLNSEIAKQMTDLNDQIERNDKLKNELLAEQQSWASQRASREAQMATLEQQISVFNENIKTAEARLTELKALAATEEASIAAARTKLEEEKAALATSQGVNAEKEAALVAREQALNTRQAQLDALKVSLDAQATEVAKQQGILAAREEEFMAKVEAARKLFIENGVGDVFEGLDANTKYSFLITVRGIGSVKNIEAIRKDVRTFNSGLGKQSDNNNVTYNPQLVKKGKDGVATIETIQRILDGMFHGESVHVSLNDLRMPNVGFGPAGDAANQNTEFEAEINGIRFFVYEDAKSQVIQTRDSYMMYGTPSAILNFITVQNKRLQTLSDSNQDKAEAVSLWVMARPVRDVRVALKLTMMGSNQPALEDRKHEVIEPVMDKIRAQDAKVQSLEDIDLNKIAQMVSDKVDLSKCETVNQVCLAMLKQSGLLNTMVEVTYTAQDGSKSKTTLSYIQYLEHMFQLSVFRINAEQRMRGWNNGFSMNVRVTPNWWAWVPFQKDYVISTEDETAIDAKMAELEKDHERANALLYEKIIEKLVLEASITMVDQINDDNSNPLDTLDHMSSIMNDGKSFRALEEIKRGEIEIALPIKTPVRVESKFNNDLIMADFKAQGEPVEPQEPNRVALDAGYDKWPMMVMPVFNYIQTGTEIETTYLSEEQKVWVRDVVKPFVAQYKVYAEQMDAYYTAKKAFESNGVTRIETEFYARAAKHAAELEFWLQELGKVK